ncbi:DUF4352 domain-containing protein [Paenibacillus faecis]|uniref:DUF4352 domain-containing protein n=1 Tax=Paenibacillus faecis TaxID=862114 RepID=A0A5D0CYX0_9BACL|nr:DUF4352 domain-containing protein [Paenibacillus faecis]TYA15231.1 DUF4352 domain-containing protein [Paenibacillus faecis]
MEKAKKKWYQKWWVWVLIILTIGIIGSNMNSTDTTKTANTAEPAKAGEDKAATTEPKQEPSKEPEKKEETAITAVGEGIQTKNFKVSVESLTKPKSDNQFIAPEEGKEFVSVGLLIENISEKDYTVSSMLMFNAYQDGFSINEDITAHAIKGQEKTMDGALAAGKKIKGNLIYQVPKDWKELEIDVDLTVLSLSNDGEVKIVLQNK